MSFFSHFINYMKGKEQKTFASGVFDFLGQRFIVRTNKLQVNGEPMVNSFYYATLDRNLDLPNAADYERADIQREMLSVEEFRRALRERVAILVSLGVGAFGTAAVLSVALVIGSGHLVEKIKDSVRKDETATSVSRDGGESDSKRRRDSIRLPGSRKTADELRLEEAEEMMRKLDELQ